MIKSLPLHVLDTLYTHHICVFVSAIIHKVAFLQHYILELDMLLLTTSDRSILHLFLFFYYAQHLHRRERGETHLLVPFYLQY